MKQFTSQQKSTGSSLSKAAVAIDQLIADKRKTLQSASSKTWNAKFRLWTAQAASLAIVALCAVIFSSVENSDAQTAFTQGNVVVLSTSGTGTNITGTLIEVDTTHSSQSGTSHAISTSGADSLRFGGSGTQCFIANSNDESLLCVPGTQTTNATTDVTTILARGVATYNTSGVESSPLPATYTSVSGNQTRGATTIDNVNYYFADKAGLYTNNGTGQIGTSTNIRPIRAFGGTLYAVQEVTNGGTPVVSVATNGTYTNLPGLRGSFNDETDFYMVQSGSNGCTYDELYILSPSSATKDTIYKFSLVSGSWTANGSYLTTIGGIGIAAQGNGSVTDLFVTSGKAGTTTANSLVKLVDASGFNQTINITTSVTLYTTTGSNELRGVALAPYNALSISRTSISFPNTSAGTNIGDSTFTVTGKLLLPATGGTITATAPSTDFQVSSNNSTWGSTANITYSGSSFSATTIYVRFSPQTPGLKSGNITFSGGCISNTSPTINVSGTAPTPPTQLAITNVNPSSPFQFASFSVTVTAEDAGNGIQNVLNNTNVTLSLSTGTGTLSGTLTGQITAGASAYTFAGLSYNKAEGIVITATRTSGDNLTAGVSSTITIQGVATHLAFANVPPTGLVNTAITTFTVQALKDDGTVDGNYTSNVTISKASGPGTLSGTTTHAAVAGIVTFNDLQFNATGTYTLNANSSTFTQITSGNIVIGAYPADLVHYWDFNSTLPCNGGGGTALNNINADFSLFPAGSAKITWTDTSTVGVHDSIIDNVNPGANPLNQRMGYAPDATCPGFDNAIRARNPSGSNVFNWYMPTTGFKNVVLKYATEGTGSGQTNQNFKYSIDGGATFITTNMLATSFTNNAASQANYVLVTVDFSNIATVKNNPNFVFQITFTGNSTGTSGNNRFDNITLEGDSICPVASLPSVSSANITNTCLGGPSAGSVQVNPSGGAGSYTYSWSNSTTADPATGLAAGNYTVTVTDANGCTVTATEAVQSVNPNPPIQGNLSFCTGSSTTLSVPGYDTYLWSPGVATTSSITVTSAGTYSVTVTSLSNTCDGTSPAVTVTQNTPPTVTVSTSASIICTGTFATLTASGASTYSWTPPAGLNQTTGAVVQATPPIDVVTYTVVGTDANGCTGMDSVAIFVDPTPNPQATYNGPFCSGGSVTVNLSCDPQHLYHSIHWTGPNGFTSTSRTPVIHSATSANAGNYTVTLQDNYCTGSQTIFVAIGTPTTSTNSATACVNYVWNGTTYTSTGTYTYQTTNAVGCDSTATLNLTISGQPSTIKTVTTACDSYTWSTNGNGQTYMLSGNYAYVNGCQIDSLYLTITASSKTVISASACGNYTWSSNGQTYYQSGSYANVTGCHTDSLYLTINANSLIVTDSSTNAVCYGGTGAAVAIASGGTFPYSYAWSNGSTTVSINAVPAGSYSVVVTDNQGCTGTFKKIIHYWNFDSTNPCGGNGGIALNNIAPDYSSIGGAQITFNQQTSPVRDSILDNSSGGTGVNLRTGYTNNTYCGNLYVRTRNPNSEDTLLFYMPTTGYSNLVLSFASQLSSAGKGELKYSYSIDGGASYITTHLTSTTYDPATTWNLETINLTGVAGVDNNANFVFAIMDTAAVQTSGNQRYDNVTLEGDSIGSDINATVNITQPSAVTSSTSITACSSYSWNGTTYTAAGTYTYDAGSSSNAPHCDSIATLILTVNGNTLVVLDSSSNSTCNGSNNGVTVAVVSGGTGPYTYLWSPGGATTQSITGLSPNSYTVTVSDAGGCTASFKKLIHYWNFDSNLPCNANGRINVSPAAADYSTIGGATITFNKVGIDSTADNVLGYKANLRTGYTSNTTIGCGNHAFRTRNPNSLDTLKFYMPTTGYQNLVLSFAVSMSSANKEVFEYMYSTDGGATWTQNGLAAILGSVYYAPAALDPVDTLVSINLSSLASVNNNANFIFAILDTITTATSGNARFDNVTLEGDSTVSGFAGSPVITTEPAAVTASINANGPTSFCTPPGSVTLTAVAPLGNVAGYKWSDNELSSAITISTAGSATYSVTVTDINGCSGTSSGTTVTATQSEKNVSTVTACNSFTWSTNGDGNTYTVSGSYAYVTGTGNCTTDSLYLTIATNPVTNVTNATACDNYTWAANGQTYTAGGAYQYVSGCVTDSLYLTVTPSSKHVTTVTACGSYAWTVNGDGNTYGSTGQYAYVNGCVTDSLYLTINPVPIVTGYSSNATCNGTNNGSATVVVATGTGTPNYSYLWSNGNTTSSITNLAAGTYSVTVTDSKGCTAAFKKLIHYWSFDNTLPLGGGGGTALNNLLPDYSTIGNAQITWSYVDTLKSLSLRDSILDNGSGGSTLNVRTGYSTSLYGNNYVRTRNPNNLDTLKLYMPTTGYKNVVLSFSAELSSAGKEVLEYIYSTDGGATWTQNGLSAILGSVYYIPGTAFGLETINLSSIAAVNNNPNFVFAILDTVSVNNTSGNCRFDNLTLDGDSTVAGFAGSSVVITGPAAPVAVITASGPTTFCTGSVKLTASPGQTTYKWSTGSTASSITVTASGSYTVKDSVCGYAAVTSAPTVVTVGSPTTSSTSQTSCDSYSWNGTTYTATGTYTYHTTNAAGCDSAATLHLTINSCMVTLNLKMFIQGFYYGGGTMQQVLFNEGVDPNPNSTNCDTVRISLVDPNNGNFVQTSTGVLQTDGSLSVTFPGSVTGNSYYIYIRHRNSILTSSATPVLINSTIYDFSSNASQAYGNNEAMVDAGIWAIYTGDINQDGFIDPFDFPSYDLDNSNQLVGVYEDNQGYSTDLNGDGYVDPFDFPVYDGNNSSQITANNPF